MKRKYCLACIAAAIGGSLLHFAYGLLPLPAVGMFAPVNESVWEHLKLLYWPVLTAGFFLSFGKDDQLRAWSGVLCSMLWTPLLLLGGYYLLHFGFAVSGIAADIVWYYAVMALGFFLAYRAEKSGRLTFLTGVFVIFVGLLGAMLVIFTMIPPDFPIFAEIL